MPLRFHISADLAAQVYSHASIAVGLIDRLIAQHGHYTEVMRAMATQQGQLGDEPDAAAQIRQIFDQLGAARDELQRLADEAQQQGTETLLARTRGHHVKIDRSLKVPPADADVLERVATLHAIQQCMQRDFRDVGDQLQRLLVPLSKVADPGALAFASELEQLAKQIRPPGAPRGPYAPRHL